MAILKLKANCTRSRRDKSQTCKSPESEIDKGNVLRKRDRLLARQRNLSGTFFCDTYIYERRFFSSAAADKTSWKRNASPFSSRFKYHRIFYFIHKLLLFLSFPKTLRDQDEEHTFVNTLKYIAAVTASRIPLSDHVMYISREYSLTRTNI